MIEVSLAPDWGQHFHDDNGYPAAGWTVHTYRSNSTTYKPAYSDSEGTILHEPAIELNSRGEYPGEGLYLTNNEPYTLELMDLDGVVKKTVNNIIASDSDTDSAVQSDWDEDDSENLDYIKNKPDIITDEERAKLVNVPDDTNGELDLKISTSLMGVSDGVATLNSNGKVPTSQLDGVVAEVQEVYIVGSTPFASDWLSDSDGGVAITPNESTIYYIITAGIYQNKQYRWGGTTYIELSASLALGETADTAYYGDKGKSAYDHSLVTSGNPHNITAEDLNLNNVDNTSDVDKPISDATAAEFGNYVSITTDEFITGEKTFSSKINGNDGIKLGGYILPTLSLGTSGQVLRVPTSGNELEWGDAVDGSGAVAAAGWSLTAALSQPTQGVTWDITETISSNAGLLDSEIDDDDNFDIATGIFTAPEDGYYYVQCQANAKSTFTGTSSESSTIAFETYFKHNNITYFNANQNYRDYLTRSFSSNSAGIIYLVEGSTIEAILDSNMQMSFTPSTITTDAKIFKCSVSFHKLAAQGIKGDKGDAGGVISVNDELPDILGNVALSADTIPTTNSDVQTELDDINETLERLERATGDFTYNALTLSSTETKLPLTLVSQSSNTDIFYINDANDTLDIIAVSSYLNLATLDFDKTTGTSVTVTYRIYNENDVQLGSDYIFYLEGSGSFQRTVHITEDDRPIGQYYATIQLNNNIPTSLLDTSLASIIAFNASNTGDNDHTKYQYIPQSSEPADLTEGGTWYDDDSHTHISKTDDGEISLGRELKYKLKNYDTTTLLTGEVVYGYAGSYTTSLNIAIKRARADSKDTAVDLFMVDEEILSGDIGEGVKVGIIDMRSREIVGTAGDSLYLSPTSAGEFQITEPDYPYFSAKVGRVLTVTSPSGYISSVLFDPDTDPRYAVGSSNVFPPTITLSNMSAISNSFGLLYRTANTNNKPSYRDTQPSQFDNGDCDPIISAGGTVRKVTITSAQMAVAEGTKDTIIYSRLEMYSIKTNTNGGPVLLATFDIPVIEVDDIGIYENTGLTPGITGTLAANISVPAGTLLGFHLANSASFTGGNSYVNSWRNSVVGISIY